MIVKYTINTKSVNSKRLLTKIREMETLFTELPINWEDDNQREIICETIRECMDEEKQNGIITQYNVICDARNNNLVEAALTGKFKLAITYKQANCINTTKLLYEITVPQMSFDDLIW